jgi:DNA-binding NarL/FixJ family response regulator
LTDAGIAGRLLLSSKTVGHHVSALLAKLGVASTPTGCASCSAPEATISAPRRSFRWRSRHPNTR